MPADPNAIRRRLAELFLLPIEGGAVLVDREAITFRSLPEDTAVRLATVLASLDDLPDDSPLWESIGTIGDHFAPCEVAVPPDAAGAAEHRREELADAALRADVRPARHLHKLAINTVNACNLACSYCYANAGRYGTARAEVMRPSDVEATVRAFAARFDHIDRVQFMGGEPSLNPQAIEQTARLFAELVDEGALAAAPRLGMVTNGVRFTPQFLEVCRRHAVDLTFSLDGPREVHDAVRRRRSGAGSFDDVTANVARARDLGLAVSFEATFSRCHLDAGMRLVDLCQWFFDEHGQRVLHAPPMSGNAHAQPGLALTLEEKIDHYGEVTVWGLDNLLEGQLLMHGFTERTLEVFRSRSPNRVLCGAGTSQLAVSHRGDVSPCWMFTDVEPFRMGNVRDGDFLGPRAVALLEILAETDLASHPDCQACWIRPACFGCRGADYFETGAVDLKTECEFQRAVMETFVVHAARVFPELARRAELRAGGAGTKGDSPPRP